MTLGRACSYFNFDNPLDKILWVRCVSVLSWKGTYSVGLFRATSHLYLFSVGWSQVKSILKHDHCLILSTALVNCLEGFWKTIKTLIRIASIWTQNFTNMKQEFYLLGHHVQNITSKGSVTEWTLRWYIITLPLQKCHTNLSYPYNVQFRGGLN